MQPIIEYNRTLKMFRFMVYRNGTVPQLARKCVEKNMGNSYVHITPQLVTKLIENPHLDTKTYYMYQQQIKMEYHYLATLDIHRINKIELLCKLIPVSETFNLQYKI